MLRFSAALAAMALSAAVFAPTATAATRMTYAIYGNATPVRWDVSAFPLKVELDQRVAGSFAGAQQVVERAFNAWAAVPDSDIRFQPITMGSSLVAKNDGRNVVTLREGLAADGILALTTYTFDSNGHFTDADIEISPNLLRGEYNVQATVQHEIGHMLGLDHSAVLSSIMYPYVARGTAALPLDSDDTIAISTTYPEPGSDARGATLQGRVTGDGGGVFAAQVVAVNQLGQPVATALTNSSGEFMLQAIPAGRYRLYAEPLDGPVETRNLGGVWRDVKVSAFPTVFMGHDINVRDGEVLGNLMVSTGGSSTLNPKWIGASWNGRQDFSLTTAPVDVKPGDNVTLAVAGDGFLSGITEFEVLNPGFKRLSDFTWAGNYVSATFAVDPAASGTSAVILVKKGSESATLTGALRIQRNARRRAA